MKLAMTYPIRLVCRLLEAPRSSVYYKPQPVPDAEAIFKSALLDVAAEWPTYGYRRLTAMMRREGWQVNGKRVRRWMEELGIQGTPPRRGKRTTNSSHAFPRYPNLVQDLEIIMPDQVWVADITYIRLRYEFVYLAVLMDVFTRHIRGWHLSRNLDQTLTLGALERALAVAIPGIHHSDQGLQYAATAYVQRLLGVGVTLSMAAVGEARENGYAERLIRTIKEEAVYLFDYRDFEDAQRHLTCFLDDVYNKKRIHSALGYLTPGEFEKRWREENRHPKSEKNTVGVHAEQKEGRKVGGLGGGKLGPLVSAPQAFTNKTIYPTQEGGNMN